MAKDKSFEWRMEGMIYAYNIAKKTRYRSSCKRYQAKRNFKSTDELHQQADQ